MSGFLIDTNVLSEYNRPGGPDPGVKRWLETTDRESQYVSVITLSRVRRGQFCLSPSSNILYRLKKECALRAEVSQNTFVSQAPVVLFVRSATLKPSGQTPEQEANANQCLSGHGYVRGQRHVVTPTSTTFLPPDAPGPDDQYLCQNYDYRGKAPR